MISNIYYRVSTFREAGLEAKWSKSKKGTPYLLAKQVEQKTWFVVTSDMFSRMKEVGVSQGFEEFTVAGNVFSISAN